MTLVIDLKIHVLIFGSLVGWLMGWVVVFAGY